MRRFHAQRYSPPDGDDDAVAQPFDIGHQLYAAAVLLRQLRCSEAVLFLFEELAHTEILSTIFRLILRFRLS